MIFLRRSQNSTINSSTVYECNLKECRNTNTAIYSLFVLDQDAINVPTMTGRLKNANRVY
jgi:hypothetical protein